MKLPVIQAIIVCLLLLTACQSQKEMQAREEFEKKWEVAEKLIIAGAYQRGARVVGLNIHDPLERGVFQRLVAKEMDFESRIIARIESWTSDDSVPTPPIYLDSDSYSKSLREKFLRSRGKG